MTNEQNDQIMQAIKELHDQMNDGFARVDKRFEEVDKRFEDVDKRLGEIDKRFDQMQEEMNEGFSQLKDGMDLLARKNFENEKEIYRIKKAIGQQ
ncbi:hypothetical protein [Lentibacillus jeotgali]|uniref:hypothetical protein n=1 Tax=Lentibacillus jeotgali TaxID=558169 RepID=UPI0002628F87|nr:hypothetical protein [Lentibacillus jeotgali]